MGGGGRETTPPPSQQQHDPEGGSTSTDLPPLPPSPNHNSSPGTRPRVALEEATATATTTAVWPDPTIANDPLPGEENVSWDVRGRRRRHRRTLATRTPQRLLSLWVPPPSSSSSLIHNSAFEGQVPPEIQSGAVAACPPLLAFQQLVVVATVDGRLCFYDLSSSHVKSRHGSSPNSSIGPNSNAHPHCRVAPSLVTHLQGGPILSVVAMCAIPNTTASSMSSSSSSSSNPTTLMGHVMVLLSHGQVQVLRIQQIQPQEEATQNSTSQMPTTQALEVTVEHSFSTHVSSAATCMACHENPSSVSSSDTAIVSKISIWVGHSCGTLTEHEWNHCNTNHTIRTHETDDDDNNNHKDDAPTKQQSDTEEMWRGTLLAPIQSIAAIVQNNVQNTNTVHNDAAKTETETEVTAWLAVGRSVVPTPGMTAVTEAVAASVEFLNVRAIQQQH
eukprot:scaffold132225_cov43-Attheya_sp.AAC.1